MGVTREDLVKPAAYAHMTEAEWLECGEYKARKSVIENYLANDAWATKIKKKVAILMTASHHGRPYLRASVESHAKLGLWTVLAYDNFLDPTLPDDPKAVGGYDFNTYMPPKDVLDRIDTLLIPHHQTWGGVSYPYVWLLRLGSGILHSFDYVYCVNGDIVLEKPENFDKLFELLGDADFLSSGPTLPREVGTAAFIIKAKAFLAVAKHMNDHMVPLEEYEKSTADFGNTEGRLAVALRELGLKIKRAPKDPVCPLHDPCEQHHVPGGTFYELVGFRHLHGELNFVHRYGKTLFEKTGVFYAPPPVRLLDPRYTAPADLEACRKFEETGDQKVLDEWYQKD